MFDDFDDLVGEGFSKEEMQVLNCDHRNTFIRGWGRSKTADLIFRKIGAILEEENPIYPEELLVICRNEEERKYLRGRLFDICGADESTEKIDFQLFGDFLEIYAPKTEDRKRTFRQVSLKRDRKMVFMVDPPENFKVGKNFIKLMSKLFPDEGAKLFFWEYEDFLDPLSIRFDFPEGNIITLESKGRKKAGASSTKTKKRTSGGKRAGKRVGNTSASSRKSKGGVSPELLNEKKSKFMHKRPPQSPRISRELFDVKKSEFMHRQSAKESAKETVSPLLGAEKTEFRHRQPPLNLPPLQIKFKDKPVKSPKTRNTNRPKPKAAQPQYKKVQKKQSTHTPRRRTYPRRRRLSWWEKNPEDLIFILGFMVFFLIAIIFLIGLAPR